MGNTSVLIRLTEGNGLWASLETEWANQAAAFDEDLRDFAAGQLTYAKGIAHEHPQDARYGIFGLKIEDSWSAIAHVNKAGLPGTAGWTLRVLWVLLAPKYDYAEVSLEEFASIAATLVHGTLGVACDMEADHVKLHLGNLGDRAFFRGVAGGMQAEDRFGKFAVRGNWLHINNVKR